MRLAVTLLLASCALAHSTERFPGQYAQVDPLMKDWFNKQVIPGTVTRCCDWSDGSEADEDMRLDADGSSHYWVRFNYMLNGAEARADWMKVPTEAVIPGPYDPRVGQPIVWWVLSEGVLYVRCFKPGSGV